MGLRKSVSAKADYYLFFELRTAERMSPSAQNQLLPLPTLDDLIGVSGPHEAFQGPPALDSSSTKFECLKRPSVAFAVEVVKRRSPNFWAHAYSCASYPSAFRVSSAAQLSAGADVRPFAGPPLPRLEQRDAVRRAAACDKAARGSAKER